MPKDKNNPWNELNPYSEGQPIYGRNQIISKLVDAIYTNLQTILYGKSGIGKTSLLQAGCFPELRKRHFFPIIIRPGIMESSNDYVANVIDFIRESAEKELLGIKPSLHLVASGNGNFTDNRLCQFLYSTKFVDDGGDIYIPILIFDQFEEFLNNKKIYTSAVSFVKELYVLLDNTISIPAGFLEYSNYRLVFAIREDYLYCLEDIVDHYNLDELRFNRHRITALTDKQAQTVIEKTFKSAVDNISSDDLSRITSIIIPAAKGQNQDADIRTPVLSLLGSLIYRQMAEGHGVGSINTDHELYLYYDEIMSEPAIPLEVRWFLEQKLITVDGRRDSMDYQSALLTNLISEEQIDYLVKVKKIIRIVDAGSGEKRLEFSHDTICRALKPVIEMRDEFYKKGNELNYSSFDKEDKQLEIVRNLSCAAELGHFEAQQELKGVYEDNLNGIQIDREYKFTHLRRDRLIVILNGGDWFSETKNDERNKKYDIYISYSRTDLAIVSQIYYELLSKGFKVWIDMKGLSTGDDFVNTIINAIDSSSLFIFIISKNSTKSSWSRKEVSYADRKGKTIIFIRIDNLPMPDIFQFHYGNRDIIDFSDMKQREKLFRYLEMRFCNKSFVDTDNGAELVTISLNNYAIQLRRVEGGVFTMGATDNQGGSEDEMPVHIVRLDSYYIGTIPVTQELWQIVQGYNPSYHRKNKKLPVENITWEECKSFVARLNKLTGKMFRLPTEAEWEYAARGGLQFSGFKYSGSNLINDVAWFLDNSEANTHEVAQKFPNELGMFDMSGNVWEWCYDWYAPYSSNDIVNPKGAAIGTKRVCRGGSCYDKDADCRITSRSAHSPLFKSAFIGFRLVLEI